MGGEPLAFTGGGQWMSGSLVYITHSSLSCPTMPPWWSFSVPSSFTPSADPPCHPPLGFHCSLQWYSVWRTCVMSLCDMPCVYLLFGGWVCVCLRAHAGVYVFVHDTSAGLSCYQIDMSVCEALLFSDVPHTGSWSLCVCVCLPAF